MPEREIKFRAWDFKNNLMSDNADLMTWMHSTFKDDLLEHFIEGHSYFMQYTGLKDKNGKEIYEGDIVNLIPDGYIKELATVEWADNNASWIYRRISELELVKKVGVYTNWKPVEVIGNIYEHSHLLDKG